MFCFIYVIVLQLKVKFITVLKNSINGVLLGHIWCAGHWWIGLEHNPKYGVLMFGISREISNLKNSRFIMSQIYNMILIPTFFVGIVLDNTISLLSRGLALAIVRHSSPSCQHRLFVVIVVCPLSSPLVN